MPSIISALDPSMFWIPRSHSLVSFGIINCTRYLVYAHVCCESGSSDHLGAIHHCPDPSEGCCVLLLHSARQPNPACDRMREPLSLCAGSLCRGSPHQRPLDSLWLSTARALTKRESARVTACLALMCLRRSQWITSGVSHGQ